MYIGPKNLGLINPNALGGAYPSVLFANNEVGVWFDAAGKDGASQAKIDSGLTGAAFLAAYPTHSLYQLSTGVTPAINPGDPIGLQIDISKGGLNNLGPEILTNGDFSNGTTGWNTVAGSTLTVNANDQLEIATGTQAISLSSNAITTVVGTTYLVEIDVIALSVGTQGVIVGTTTSGSNLLSDLRTTLGKRRAFFTATTTTSYLSWTCGSTSRTATIDNITIRAVPGNHRYQTTTANRPVLARIPEGGRRNVLTNTEALTNAYWRGLNATIAVSATTPPASISTSFRVQETAVTGEHRWEHTNADISVISGSAYTITVFARAAERTIIRLGFDNFGSIPGRAFFDLSTGTFNNAAVGTTASITNVGNGWYRCQVTATATSTTTTRLELNLVQTTTVVNYLGDIANGVLITAPQVELGSTVTAYQKVTINADVTESGKRDCWGILYNGVDQSFLTQSVDFSATDEMTVWTGLRKLSDAASATLVELSADANGNNGAFAVYAPRVAAATVDYRTRGTTTVSLTDGATSPSPTTLVFVGASDISADSTIVRKNGVQVNTSSSDQGTGNYGNYPLYFGRRNNTFLPYNGYEFGTIIRGKTTPTSQINIFEQWMARRAGITI